MNERKKPETLIPVYTSIPEAMVKRIQKQAQLQHLKVADFLRKWIIEGFKEEIGE